MTKEILSKANELNKDISNLKILINSIDLTKKLAVTCNGNTLVVHPSDSKILHGIKIALEVLMKNFEEEFNNL